MSAAKKLIRNIGGHIVNDDWFNEARELHFRAIMEFDAKVTATRNGYGAEIKQLNEVLSDVYAKAQGAGKPFSKTDEDGKMITIDPATPFRAEAKQVKKEIHRLEKARQKLPRPLSEMLLEGVKNAGECRDVPTGNYTNTESLEDLYAQGREVEEKIRAVHSANVSDDDAENRIRAECQRIAANSEFNVESVLAPGGGAKFPTRDFSGVAGRNIVVPDVLPVLLKFVPQIADAWVADAKKANKGRRQIALADRPALLETLDGELLTIRRKCEFAARRDEGQGKLVIRPKNIDWRILLWVDEIGPPVKPKLGRLNPNLPPTTSKENKTNSPRVM